ncbi:MAG: galactokinase [Deltaproteobacteria bacterium]|nr:galactokinase [Deltaproteobacteria bacterium]
MTITSRSIRDAFVSRFGGQPKLFCAPGRVNIIGGHTDYNGGFVLPTTTGLHTWVAIAPRADRTLRVFSRIFDSLEEIDLDRIEKCDDAQWYQYVKGVASILEGAGHTLRGADIVIDGDIPLGGGLSSSASLETALAFALLDCAAIEIERGELAQLCQRVETEFVGIRCGIMDQYVISRCAKDHAMMLDCRSLEFQLVPMPADARLLVVDTGVSHRLPTGEYNSRRNECEEAVARLAGKIPQLGALRDLGLDQLEENRNLLDDRLYRRCRHIVSEIQRVEDACSALRRGDARRLGELVTASHASLRDDYEISCSELDALVEIMNACPEVYGSRLVGGGFGGCAVCLVHAPHLDRVMHEVQTEYAAQLGRRPWAHAVTPSDPVGPAPAIEPFVAQ